MAKRQLKLPIPWEDAYARMRSGDVTAQRETEEMLWAACIDLIRWAVHYFTSGEVGDPVDLAGKAFVRVTAKLRDGTADESLANPVRWVVQRTGEICSTARTSDERRTARYEEAMEDASQPLGESPRDPDAEIEEARDQWIEAQRHERLEQAIVGLSPEHQAVIRLHFLEVRETEMAKILKIDTSAVRRRLVKAQARLRETLLELEAIHG